MANLLLNYNGESFVLPASLKPRCMRVHGWDEETTDKALLGYRQFLYLKLCNEDWDGNKLVASATVLAVWKEHALDRESYDKACIDYCGEGKLIVLDPENELEGTNPNKDLDTRIDKTQIALNSAFGSLHVDLNLWSFDASTRQDTKGEGQKVVASLPAAESAKGGSGASITLAASSQGPAGDQVARTASNQSSGATNSENQEGGGNKNDENEDGVIEKKSNDTSIKNDDKGDGDLKNDIEIFESKNEEEVDGVEKGISIRKNDDNDNGDLENDIDDSKSKERSDDDKKKDSTVANKSTDSEKGPEEQDDKPAGKKEDPKPADTASFGQDAKEDGSKAQKQGEDAMIWVMQGKMPHQAFLVEVHENGSKRIRWESTGDLVWIDSTTEVRNSLGGRGSRRNGGGTADGIGDDINGRADKTEGRRPTETASLNHGAKMSSSRRNGGGAVESFHDYDVLTAAKSHPGIYQKKGNIHYREIVASKQQVYQEARKSEKRAIAQECVDAVQQKGGRFLRRDDDAAGTVTWVEIENDEAIVKVQKAFRAAKRNKRLREEKNSLVMSEAQRQKKQKVDGKESTTVAKKSDDPMEEGDAKAFAIAKTAKKNQYCESSVFKDSTNLIRGSHGNTTIAKGRKAPVKSPTSRVTSQKVAMKSAAKSSPAKPDTPREKLIIRVEDAEGEYAHFKLYDTQKLRKVFQSFHSFRSRSDGYYTFCFRGSRLTDECCARQLRMGHYDHYQIDAIPVDQIDAIPVGL